MRLPALLVLAILLAAACGRPSATSSPAAPPVAEVTPAGAAPIAGVGSPPQAPNGLPACPSGPFFDRLPLDLDDFRAFRPLGFTSVPIHIMPARFSAFSRSLPGETRPPGKIYFPGGAWVTQILTTEFPATGAKGFQLQFAPCKDTKFQFNHIGSLSQKLQAALEATPLTNCREFDSGQGQIAKTCQANPFVRVESGEQVGLSDEFAGVDFVAIDYRLPPAAFANAASYTRDFFYYTSPIGYFTPELRAQLLGKTGSYDGARIRTALPVEGVYMQDQPGTAQGNWFLPGQSPAQSSSSDGTLALVHEYVDSTQPLLVVGTGVPGLKSGQYSFAIRTSGTVNRDWPAVAAGGAIYCYEGWLPGRTAGALPLGQAGGVVLISLAASDRLRIEMVPGLNSCPAAPAFSPAAVVYQR